MQVHMRPQEYKRPRLSEYLKLRAATAGQLYPPGIDRDGLVGSRLRHLYNINFFSLGKAAHAQSGKQYYCQHVLQFGDQFFHKVSSYCFEI